MQKMASVKYSQSLQSTVVVRWLLHHSIEHGRHAGSGRWKGSAVCEKEVNIYVEKIGLCVDANGASGDGSTVFGIRDQPQNVARALHGVAW